MKELSIEEKAARYDEAIKVANKYKDTHIMFPQIKDEIFPELKESEDERIRKDIIVLVKDWWDRVNKDNISTKEQMLAWLEKQGQKPQGKSALEAAKEEKVNNQNCVKPANKFEPKFKNGQWIVWQDKYYKVNDNGCGYELVDQNGLSTSLKYSTIDENARIWDITKDANDGDVLVASDGSIFLFKGTIDCACKHYIAVTTDNVVKFNEGLEHYWETSTAVHPATKEQRDTLIKAMTDAGYTFDFEKKELKKIIDEKQIKKNLQDNSFRRMFEQKPWSEDDEKIALSIEQVMNCASLLNIVPEEVDKIRTWLKSIKDRALPQSKQEWSEEDDAIRNDLINYFRGSALETSEKEVINWLKSLRPQNTWKPSDEQMDVLLSEVTAWTKGCPKQIVLESLYNDLKKLKL